MTTYQWVTLGLGALGFLGTWILGAFYLGRAVEQMQAAIKRYIDDERDKLFDRIEETKARFAAEQKTQDHNFGEVGHAMRAHIAQVEDRIREVEIWGRDNYVQKCEFEKATDRLTDAIKSMASDIKADIRGLNEKIDEKR